MKTIEYDLHVTRLCRYTIASADMYFSEMEQRDVCVCGDVEGGLCIWAEASGQGPGTRIDLSQIFLEYALYCRSWCNSAEAHYHMHGFGEQLGSALAGFIGEMARFKATGNHAVPALKLVLDAMHACHKIEPAGPESDLIMVDCPLETAARHSGLGDVELAHHGINIMCQSLMRAMNPSLLVSTSEADSPEFIFTITSAVHA